ADAAARQLRRYTAVGAATGARAASEAVRHATCRFTLRQDARFHDGQPVTAADVVFTLRELQRRRTACAGEAGDLLPFHRVEASGPYTVTVHLAAPPRASFLHGLRQAVLPAHLLGPYLHTDPEAGDQLFARRPVASGRYRFDAWLGGDQVRLVAAEGHWRGPARMDTLVIAAGYADADALWADLVRGKLDVVDYGWCDDCGGDDSAQSVRALRAVAPGYVEVAFNSIPGRPLSDVRLRQALSLAVDRRAIWHRLGGTDEVADSLAFGPGSFVMGAAHPHASAIAAPPDRPAAAALLDAAGWRSDGPGALRRKGDRPLELLLLLPAGLPRLAEVGALLRTDLEAIGVRLAVRSCPASALVSRDSLRGWDYDLLLLGRTFTWDPDRAVGPFHSAGQTNFGWYADAETDALIEHARQSFDASERATICRRLQHRLAMAVPSLFVCRWPVVFGFRKGLEGAEGAQRVGLFRSLPDWHWDRVPTTHRGGGP
ncbi:MAG: ABC transporter substrate-binding protein, partial [Candidatus Latescibacterota bacterium]